MAGLGYRREERRSEPQGPTAGLQVEWETCGRAFGGVRRPAPIRTTVQNCYPGLSALVLRFAARGANGPLHQPLAIRVLFGTSLHERRIAVRFCKVRRTGVTPGHLEGAWRMFSTRWRMAAAGVTLALIGGGRSAALADHQPAKPADTPAADAPPAEEGPAPAKHRLAFKFQPDQIVRYEVFNESEITTHVNDETETVRNISKARRHYRVKAIDEKTGNADLELSIDWVHMLASFDNPSRPKTEPVEFQSDDPEKQPRQFQDIAKSIRQPRGTIQFSPSGKPLEIVDGVPVKKAAPANQPAQGAAAPPLHDTSPESFLISLPEQPVAVGESWKERFDIIVRDSDKNLFKVTIQRSFKLAEVKEGRARIDFGTVVLTPIPNPSIEGQLIQRQINGNVVFDITRGLIVSREAGVDRTVYGPLGPKSSMRAKSEYRERLLSDETIAESKGKDVR